MVMISSEARSRIQKYGKETLEIGQKGLPNVHLFVPLVNPFSEKRLYFKAQYKITGVSLEEMVEGIMFGNFTSFMDMKLDEYSRKNKTRHFKINPFTKKLEEVWGGTLGKVGVSAGHTVAAGMVAALGLVEWHMRMEPPPNPDLAAIHVNVDSRFFRGVFMFRVHRQPDCVIVDDDWLPEGGGDVRTATLPMGNLVLSTHPLGFEQIVERVTDKIVQARHKGSTYVGQIGPPSIALD